MSDLKNGGFLWMIQTHTIRHTQQTREAKRMLKRVKGTYGEDSVEYKDALSAQEKRLS